MALAMYRLVAFGMNYTVWVAEFLVNGTRPIPPHHGPDNWVEEVVYFMTCIVKGLAHCGLPLAWL